MLKIDAGRLYTNRLKTLLLGPNQNQTFPMIRHMVVPVFRGSGTGPDESFTVKGSIVPSSNEEFSLGTPTMRWKDLYLSGATIHLGISSLSADPETGGLVVATPTSVQELVTSGGAGVFTDVSACNVTASNVYTEKVYIDADAIIYRPASNQMAFATLGEERMRILDSGFVGIGTSAPVSVLHIDDSTTLAQKYPPQALLALSQSVVFSEYGNGTYVASASSSDTPAYKAFNSAVGTNEYWQSGSFYNGQGGAYTGVTTTVTATETLAGEWIQIALPSSVIMSSYVISPRQEAVYYRERRNMRKWWLVGSTNGTSWTILDARASQSWTSNSDVTFMPSSTSTAYSIFRIICNEVGNVGVVGDNALASVGDIAFYGGDGALATFTLSAHGSTKVKIMNNGNVGIGTGSPQEPLHVNGTVKATSFVGDGSLLTGIVSTGGAEALWMSAGSSNVYVMGSNVGIGTLAPLQKLHVEGTIKATSFVGDGSLLTGVATASTSIWSQNSSNVYVIGSNVGIGTSAPACVLHINDTSGSGSASSATQKYPPAAMSSNSLSVSGGAYGNGAYTSSASTESGGAAWKAFNYNKTNEQWWMSAANYFNSTNVSTGGTYTGSVSTTASGQTLAGEWLQFQVPTAIQLTSYVISPRQTSSYELERRNLRKWWLLGSTDGTTWTIINEQDNILWTTYDDKTFTFSAAQAYTHFRIVCNKVGNPGTGDNLAATVGELAYYGFIPGTAGAVPSFLLSHLGTPLSLITNTGDVGFGTTTPQEKLHVVGTVKATSFVGDGSLLTGIVSGGGGSGTSVWSQSSTNVYVTGSNVGIGKTNPQKALDVVGDVGVNGTLYMTGNIMPTSNQVYDLGSSNMRFRELYLSGNTIYLGSNVISVNEAGQVDVGNVYAENFIGLNLTAANITASNVSFANLAVSGTLDAKLDTNTVQIGTSVAQFVNIGTSTLTQTINVGTGSGVTTINIGGAGDTVNIAGTLTTVNTTNTTITDNRITLNKGGAVGSGGGAGFTVEEDESQTGHVKTTNGRDGWELKAPATGGVVTVIPGALGFEVSASNMWTASGTNVYRPSSGVGIGTVPTGALDVVGTVKATSFVGDGSLLTGIVSGGGSGTSVWTPSSSNVYVVGSNVGIGLTNPSSKLHVVGDTRIQGNLTVDSLSFNVLVGTQTIMNTNVSVTDQLVVTNEGTGPALIVNQTGTQPILEVQDDGVTVLQIIDGGNVGVGTTAPQEKLHVEGTVKASSFVGDGSLLTGLPAASVWSQSSTNVYVTGSNVGIGKTNPQKALDVVGDVGVNGTFYMTGNMMPTSNEVYDLGSSNMRFRELYLSGNTIYLGSNVISVNEAGQVDVGNVYAENFIGLNLTAANITASNVSIANLAVSGTLDAKLDTNTVQIGTSVAQFVNIGTSTLTQTINVGTGSGVTTINIGGAGDTVNIAGTLATVNTTNTTITDNRITLNKGGAAGSGGGAGFTVEEDESQTGHVKTTNGRDGWELKAPATSGLVTVIPGAVGFEVSASNMWTASGTNVYRPLGGVGIGTVPVGALDVVGTVKATSFVGDGSLLTGIVSSGGGSSLWSQNAGSVYVTGSNVGIGTSAPICALHVNDISGTSIVTTPIQKYPPSAMSSNSLTVTVSTYGNGVYTSSTSSDGGGAAWKAFNFSKANNEWWMSAANYFNSTNVSTGGTYTGSVSTTASGQALAGEWLQFQVPVALQLTSYVISPRQSSTYDLERRNLRTWWLLGSTDGIAWTIINSQDGILWTTYDDKTFTFAATQAYTYYRIVCNKVGNPGTGDNLAATVGELAFYGTVTTVTQLDGNLPSFMISHVSVPRATITNSGNVGFGTTNPQQKVHVEGTVKATSFVGDGSLLTGLAVPSAWISSSSNVYVENSNIGIGLTNPTSKLHVVGDTRIEGNLIVNGTQTIYNTFVGTTEQLIVTNDGTGPALVINQTGAQPVLDVQDDGVSVMKIIDGGNVGFGTTNPQQKLHVVGTVKATSFVGDGSLLTGISGGGGGGSGALITFGDTQVAKHAFGGHEPAATGNYYVGTNISWLTATTSDSAKALLSVKCSIAGSDTENAYRRFETIVHCKNDEVALKPKGIMNAETANFYTDAFSGLTHEVVRSTANSIDVKIKWSSTMAPYVTNAVFELVAPLALGTISFSNVYGTF